jgi:hypothetical protein
MGANVRYNAPIVETVVKYKNGKMNARFRCFICGDGCVVKYVDDGVVTIHSSLLKVSREWENSSNTADAINAMVKFPPQTAPNKMVAPTVNDSHPNSANDPCQFPKSPNDDAFQMR